MNETFYIISYDIAEDRRRNKVARCLENYGSRVQYSVFECILEQQKLDQLKNEITTIINNEEDSVRVYSMCSSCLGKVSVIGCGEITKDEDIYVV